MKISRSFLARIAAGLRGQCSFDEPMARHTSFRIGGPADLLAIPADVADLQNLLAVLGRSVPYMVIGNGTNLLVGDRGIRGVVIKIGSGLTAVERNGTAMTVAAGMRLPKLVEVCQAQGLSGLEWAVGIPGSVGGALVMNAGAYGGQMSDVVTAASGLTPSGDRTTVAAKDINFSYRHAEYPCGFIITGCRLQLKADKPAAIKARTRQWLQKRKANQPLSLPSAGCIFKNPPNDSARRLIGVAGLRGARLGGAQVSRKHANFIVNYGGATAADVLKLMDQVRNRVYKEIGIELIPEVKVVGVK